MEIEEGIIEKTSRRKALVRIQKSGACASCSSHNTCDIVSSKEKMTIEVANSLNAEIGDQVEISIPEGFLLKLSLMVYFLPVVALVCGALLGAKYAEFSHMDISLTAIVGGALAVSLVFYMLKRFERNPKNKDRYYPRMTRIIVSAKRPSADDSR